VTGSGRNFPDGSECAGFAYDCDCARCEIARSAWAERPRLLALARRRLPTAAEADDVVSEAITRSLESKGLDPARLPAWLTTVTVHLCVDRARERSHKSKDWQYAVQEQVHSDFETQLVESLAAAEIAPLLEDLPPDQAAALWLRADGLTVAAIASRLSVSEKAAESLLGRARVAARAIVGAVAGAAALVMPLVRRTTAIALPAVAVAAAVAVLTVTVVTGPSTGAGGSATQAARQWPGLSIVPSSEMPVGRVHADGTSATKPSGEQNRFTRPLARSPRDVNGPLVKVHDDGSGYQDQQQSFVESVEQCVQKGVVVSPQYIGCKTIVVLPA
jgi:RNA polymerase sigma factor (sigma-70 family)